MKNVVLSGEKLVVLGKGLEGNPKKGEPVRINIHSTLSTIAAGLLFQNEKVKHIVFTGAATKGKGHISEAKAMSDYLFDNFRGIPRDAVSIEERGFDTVANITELIAQRFIEPESTVPVLSLRQHLWRSRIYFWEIALIKAETISSQKIIKKYGNRDDKRLLRSFNRSSLWCIETIKEAALAVFATLFDRKGKLLRFFTKRSRG
jgi:hypothetical protein